MVLYHETQLNKNYLNWIEELADYIGWIFSFWQDLLFYETNIGIKI